MVEVHAKKREMEPESQLDDLECAASVLALCYRVVGTTLSLARQP